MRHLKKVIIFALIMLMLVPTTSVQAASKGLEKKSVEIGVKDKVVISSKNYGDVKSWSISGGSAKITSKDSTSATIKGVKKGKSTLKAKIGNKVYKCIITVKDKGTTSSIEIFNFMTWTDATWLYENEEITILSKNSKKVKSWSISGDSVKITSKTSYSVAIKGIKGGESILKAEIGNEVYECEIAVVGNEDSNFLKKKIEIEPIKNIDGTKILLKMKNTSVYALNVSGKVVFYDSKGNIIDTSPFSMIAMDRNKIIYDCAYCDKPYSSYKVLLEDVNIAIVKSCSDKITVKDYGRVNDGEDIYFSVTNSLDTSVYFVRTTVIAYDINGNFLDYWRDQSDMGPDSTDYHYYSYYGTGGIGSVAYYDIFVSSACTDYPPRPIIGDF